MTGIARSSRAPDEGREDLERAAPSCEPRRRPTRRRGRGGADPLRILHPQGQRRLPRLLGHGRGDPPGRGPALARTGALHSKPNTSASPRSSTSSWTGSNGGRPRRRGPRTPPSACASASTWRCATPAPGTPRMTTRRQRNRRLRHRRGRGGGGRRRFRSRHAGAQEMGSPICSPPSAATGAAPEAPTTGETPRPPRPRAGRAPGQTTSGPRATRRPPLLRPLSPPARRESSASMSRRSTWTRRRAHRRDRGVDTESRPPARASPSRPSKLGRITRRLQDVAVASRG